MRKEFNYNESSGVSICSIWYKGHLIEAHAICHSEDKDMQSERTGCFIAECRANIALLQYRKNSEIKPALTTLKHIQKSFESSKYYNPNSYESKFILSQIKVKENELSQIKSEIAMEKQYLDDYIKNKDIIYKRIRKDRKQ